MLKNIFSLLVLSTLAAACGDSIPGAYRGDFVDARTGASLQLSSDKGIYTESSGRVIEGKSFELKFADLQKGKPGVYFKDNPKNKNLLELYWLTPDVSTKKEAGGVETVQAEIFYFRMDRYAPDKVDILKAVHSMDGVISLDAPTSQWQVGWPAESEMLEFRRTEK